MISWYSWWYTKNVPSLDNFLILPLFLIIWECLTHLPLSQKDGTVCVCVTLDHCCPKKNTCGQKSNWDWLVSMTHAPNPQRSLKHGMAQKAVSMDPGAKLLRLLRASVSFQGANFDWTTWNCATSLSCFMFPFWAYALWKWFMWMKSGNLMHIRSIPETTSHSVHKKQTCLWGYERHRIISMVGFPKGSSKSS